MKEKRKKMKENEREKKIANERKENLENSNLEYKIAYLTVCVR